MVPEVRSGIDAVSANNQAQTYAYALAATLSATVLENTKLSTVQHTSPLAVKSRKVELSYLRKKSLYATRRQILRHLRMHSRQALVISGASFLREIT